MLLPILFSAVAATAFSNMAAFAQSSDGVPFKGNVTASIGSDQGKEKGNVNATANIGGNASTERNMTTSAKLNASVSYKPSYPKEKADQKRPFTVHTEKH